MIIGSRRWVIPEGYLPPDDPSKPRQFISHEACCILNAGDEEAHVEITIYFTDREPAGPFHFTVGARRTRHLRFNDFYDPETIPVDTDYSSVIASNVPIVVQYTRLDSRAPNLALLSTVAYSEGS
jgi:hypothetical protein